MVQIAEEWACVYVAEEELAQRNLCAGTLTEKDVRRVLREAEIPKEWNDVDVELYPGRGEVLIFVRCSPSWAWYSFADLEAVLHAVQAQESAESLWYLDGSYILGFPGGRSCTAEEFGHLLPAGKYFAAYLQEHGRPIIRENAVSVLKNAFRHCNSTQL